MRRVILLLAAMAAMVLGYAGAALAEEPTDTLDAHYLDATEVSYSGFTQNYQQGQTFTVENTGHLTRAEVKVNRSEQTTSDLKMTIVSVDASTGLPTTNVLASASLPASQIVTYGGGRTETFTFDDPATVRAGKKYAFVMDGTEGQSYFFGFEMDSFNGPSPGYPSGEGYWLNHDYTVSGTLPDHIFAIYVAPGDVPDVTSPVLSLPGNITKEAEGPNGATVSWSSPTATDDVDDSVTVNCDKTSGDTFPLGTTTVTCSATDAAGNTASGSFAVTVQDTTAPDIAARGDVTVTADSGATSAVVNYADPTATDVVDGSVPVNCTPQSGSTFALGTTTVSCTVTDAAGNSANTGFSVTVRDGTAPMVVATSPANGATGVSRTANVTATFSEAMKKASIEIPEVAILKKSSDGVAVTATVTYNSTTKKVIINPNASLARNTVYSVRITNAATDRAGNRLDQDPTKAGNQAKTWKFKTAT